VTNQETGLESLISPAAAWAAALLLAASIGGLWMLLADSPWEFALLAAPLALVGVAGITRQQSRARVRKRLEAALDAYAEREINKARRATVLKRVRTLPMALGLHEILGSGVRPGLGKQ
jgi:hypothetical protein